MRKLEPRFWAAGAIVLLWCASVLLPAVEPQNDEPYPGYMLLILGWLGVFVFQFGWFANLLLAPAVVLLLARKSGRRLPRIVGAGLLLLSFNALFWREMYYDQGSRPIETYHEGYYLWFMANLVASFALFARARVRDEAREQPGG